MLWVLTIHSLCRWNARTIDIYWRNWNMPVHHWVTRHLCNACCCLTCTSTTAINVLITLISALHHFIQTIL